MNVRLPIALLTAFRPQGGLKSPLTRGLSIQIIDTLGSRYSFRRSCGRHFVDTEVL